jgi:hypothetical protein
MRLRLRPTLLGALAALTTSIVAPEARVRFAYTATEVAWLNHGSSRTSQFGGHK